MILYLKFEEEKNSELWKITSESNKHLASVCENIEEQIEENQKLISETLQQLTEEEIDEEMSVFENQIINSISITGQIKTSIDNRSQDYTNFLGNGIVRVGDLVDKKYHDEEATGRTPKRKSNTDGPIQILKTKPHDELLDSYRRRNQIEMVVEDFKQPSPLSPGPVDSSASNSSSLVS